ncbi:uncharacterized protein LOC142350511 isoform X2 [Convolutriloba macropyga]
MQREHLIRLGIPDPSVHDAMSLTCDRVFSTVESECFQVLKNDAVDPVDFQLLFSDGPAYVSDIQILAPANESHTNLTGLVVSTATEDGIVNQCGVVQSALLPGEWMSFKCISDTRYDRLTITTLRTPSVDAFLCEVVAFGYGQQDL